MDWGGWRGFGGTDQQDLQGTGCVWRLKNSAPERESCFLLGLSHAKRRVSELVSLHL